VLILFLLPGRTARTTPAAAPASPPAADVVPENPQHVQARG
jgi:hypothetical protein